MCKEEEKELFRTELEASVYTLQIRELSHTHARAHTNTHTHNHTHTPTEFVSYAFPREEVPVALPEYEIKR